MSTVNGFQVGSETLKYNYESLENYNTPNFSTSSSTAYAVGDYVMYNGKLYKCTAATTGGTWVSGSWTEAVLSDDVGDLTRQLNDETTGLDSKAPVILETVSGAIASFDDGADSMPIRKLVAQIEPVQDLHGYEYPWPAGGGVNKFIGSGYDQTKYGISYVFNSDGSVDATGTATTQTWNYADFYTALDAWGLSVGDTISISVFGNDVNFGVQFYDDNTMIGGASANDSSRTSTIPEGTTRLRMLIYCKISTAPTVGEVINKTIYPQLEKASTPSSIWSPYANICQISGWTGADIKSNYVINVFDRGYFGDDYADYWDVYSGTGSVENGVLTVTNAIGRNGVRLRNNYPVIINSHKYLRSFSYKSTAVITTYMFGAKTLGASAVFKLVEDIITNAASASATYDTFPNNVGTVGTFSLKNIMLIDLTAMFGAGKEPSTVEEFRAMFPDEYYPYNDGTQLVVGDGSKISVNWEDEAGTVYGGEDEVTTGKLKKTMGMVDLGTLEWTMQEGSAGQNIRFYTSALSAIAKKPAASELIGLISSVFVEDTDPVFSRTKDNVMYLAGNGNLYIEATQYATAADFKNDMAGQTLVYPLADPVEYYLTPQEMTTLYGTNNIWSSTGDTEVTYPADTKLFIEKLTQPTEDDMTADHAISSGTFFMIGNTLYLATSQIAAGGTITPGTNATQLSLADALNTMNS